jgi:hypothetical protein
MCAAVHEGKHPSTHLFNIGTREFVFEGSLIDALARAVIPGIAAGVLFGLYWKKIRGSNRIESHVLLLSTAASTACLATAEAANALFSVKCHNKKKVELPLQVAQAD